MFIKYSHNFYYEIVKLYCTRLRCVRICLCTKQPESSRTEEYRNVDGQKSRHVTDVGSTNVSQEHQTSFFERGVYNQGVVRENSQKSSVDRNISKQTRKQTAPRFVSAPQGKIAEQGRDVCLDAIIDSYPPSDITWSKNGVELFSDGHKYVITNEVNKTRLDVRCLAVENAGQYTCKAVNAAGGTSCTTDIIVRSELNFLLFFAKHAVKCKKKKKSASLTIASRIFQTYFPAKPSFFVKSFVFNWASYT